MKYSTVAAICLVLACFVVSVCSCDSRQREGTKPQRQASLQGSPHDGPVAGQERPPLAEVSHCDFPEHRVSERERVLRFGEVILRVQSDCVVFARVKDAQVITLQRTEEESKRIREAFEKELADRFKRKALLAELAEQDLSAVERKRRHDRSQYQQEAVTASARYAARCIHVLRLTIEVTHVLKGTLHVGQTLLVDVYVRYSKLCIESSHAELVVPLLGKENEFMLLAPRFDFEHRCSREAVSLPISSPEGRQLLVEDCKEVFAEHLIIVRFLLSHLNSLNEGGKRELARRTHGISLVDNENLDRTRAWWAREEELYRAADSYELPPEKKEELLANLKKWYLKEETPK